MSIRDVLSEAIKRGASDLHLSAGLPLMLRVHGDISSMTPEILWAEQAVAMLAEIMPPHKFQYFKENLEVDFSFEIENVARFRVNAFHQERGVAACFRVIPTKILTLAELNAPSALSSLALQKRGLVLVAGATGSGKSTTLAAMVNHLNENGAGHVLSIEDPIEFIHRGKNCVINQREVGNHTFSFSNALRSALREDPDVILVGEMRDLETIRLALTAAETGHLVLATLHTNDAAKAIDRIIDVFPGDEKNMVRAMLSESLLAVISQILCKRKSQAGRVAAYEVMIATPAIRNLIREGKIMQIHSNIQTGFQFGMQTFDQALNRLIETGTISQEEANQNRNHRSVF